MKIEDLIYRVQSAFSEIVKTAFEPLPNRLIYNKLLSVRSKIVVQKINKRQPISQWEYQTIGCLEMIKAKPFECPCAPPVDCFTLRSKSKLPKPLTGILDGHELQSVSTIDGGISYSQTTWTAKKFKKGSKFTSNKPDYFIRDGYLFITCKNSPKMISITGLFENPIEVAEYQGLCEADDNPCQSFLDKEFPIEQDQIDTLIELTANELILPFSRNQQQQQ
jgi:hypothetical protein